MTTREILKDNQNPLADSLVATVLQHGRDARLDLYIVGGYLRDLLWITDKQVYSSRPGALPARRDIDFAVAGGSAFDFARQAALSLGGHFVALDRANDTARVVLNDGNVLDFVGCIGGSIESDIHRRDFTVNALAWHEKEPLCVLDLVGGCRDIEQRVIRAIAQQVLLDDPLRLLRAFRFKAVLGADIDGQTLDWIKQSAGLIAHVAPERINYEMFTLLDCHGAGAILEEMGRAGLLEVIYPELQATRQVTPNAFHHLGLFDHSVETVKELELKLAEFPDWAQKSFKEELSQGVSRLAATKLAALLHDIGKPATWQINEEGRHTFFGHDLLGEEMAEVTAERMKWSKQLSRFIAKLIRWHLRPGQLFFSGPPSQRAILRFYRKLEGDLPELILLAFGDLGATRGAGLPDQSRRDQSLRLKELLDGYIDFIKVEEELPRLLTGVDVMNILQIKPGPEVGEILQALAEAQGVSEVTDRQSAERFIEDYQRKKYSR